VIRPLLFLGIFAFFSSLAYAEDTPSDIVDRKDYDSNTPYFQKIVPSWAAGFRVAFNSVPVKTAIGSIEELYLEKLLHFQVLGVFSAGAHIGLAPLTLGRYDNWKYGVEIRYQLRFVENQIVVPTASVFYDTYRFKAFDNSVDAQSTLGIMFGAMLNLGFFDRDTARESYQTLNLVRSYLTMEVTPIGFHFNGVDLSGNPISGSSWYDGTNVSGTIWYWGIRLEFE